MDRDRRIDGLKFILIFCVVLGHLSYQDYGLHLSRMIYSFHMPAFVFLSGYLTPQSPSPEKQKRWVIQTCCIFFIAQALHLGLNLILHEQIGIHSLFDPAFALWYLVCLFYWRVASWTIFRGCNDIYLILTSLALAFLSGFIPIDHTFSFQRAFAFLPYFSLGLLFRDKDILPKIEKIPWIMALILMLGGMLLSRYLPVYQPKYHYFSISDLFMRMIQTLLGIIICMCVIRLSRTFKLEYFASLGRYSLWIYIGHTFLVRSNVLETILSSRWGVSVSIGGALAIALLYCLLFAGMAHYFFFIKKNPPFCISK